MNATAMGAAFAGLERGRQSDGGLDVASAQAMDQCPLCMRRMASPDVVYQNISERSEFSGAAPVASLPKSTDLHERLDGASRCLYNKNLVVSGHQAGGS